jgi:hypothetical protein
MTTINPIIAPTKEPVVNNKAPTAYRTRGNRVIGASAFQCLVKTFHPNLNNATGPSKGAVTGAVG